jgi:hypothetical protein
LNISDIESWHCAGAVEGEEWGKKRSGWGGGVDGWMDELMDEEWRKRKKEVQVRVWYV